MNAQLMTTPHCRVGLERRLRSEIARVTLGYATNGTPKQVVVSTTATAIVVFHDDSDSNYSAHIH